jgi:hypothetical protein
VSTQTAAAAAATLVAAACTVTMALRARRARRAAPPIAWTVGFAVYTVATGTLWYGAARGWSEESFRLYYLSGGILVVAYLAVGELLLVAPGRRATRLVVATMLWLTFAAAAAVLAAQVDTAKLARATATPPNGAMGGPWTTVLAIVLNSAGTGVLLAGSLGSAMRRHDRRPLLISAGVVVIALASTATRLGSYELFALGQACGLVLILLGIVLPPGRAHSRSRPPTGAREG